MAPLHVYRRCELKNIRRLRCAGRNRGNTQRVRPGPRGGSDHQGDGSGAGDPCFFRKQMFETIQDSRARGSPFWKAFQRRGRQRHPRITCGPEDLDGGPPTQHDGKPVSISAFGATRRWAGFGRRRHFLPPITWRTPADTKSVPGRSPSMRNPRNDRTPRAAGGNHINASLRIYPVTTARSSSDSPLDRIRTLHASCIEQLRIQN